MAPGFVVSKTGFSSCARPDPLIVALNCAALRSQFKAHIRGASDSDAPPQPSLSLCCPGHPAQSRPRAAKRRGFQGGPVRRQRPGPLVRRIPKEPRTRLLWPRRGHGDGGQLSPCTGKWVASPVHQRPRRSLKKRESPYRRFNSSRASSLIRSLLHGGSQTSST